MSLRVMSKRTSHSLAAGCPPTLAGEKSQRFTACTAASPKNLLDDDAGEAPVTFPEASTWALTITRTVPWMVLRDFAVITGNTSLRTAPCVTEPAGATGTTLEEAATGAWCAGAKGAAVMEAEELESASSADEASLLTYCRSLAGATESWDALEEPGSVER